MITVAGREPLALAAGFVMEEDSSIYFAYSQELAEHLDKFVINTSDRIVITGTVETTDSIIIPSRRLDSRVNFKLR
jgi:hypothetical protein